MSNLSNDLIQIRKQCRLSRQDVYNKCRIPLDTIAAIEDGSIFEKQLFNKTYLRTYFRSYAKAVGITDRHIIEALDELEAGTYQDRLAREYLQDYQAETEDLELAADQKDSPEGPSSSDKATGEVGAGQKQDAENAQEAGQTGSDLSQIRKSKIITPEIQEKNLSDIDWEDSNIKNIPSTSTTGKASTLSTSPQHLPDHTPAPPDIGQVDWAHKVRHAVYKPPVNRLPWVILAIILGLAMAGGIIYWYWLNNNSASTLSYSVEAPPPEASPGLPPIPPHDSDDPLSENLQSAESVRPDPDFSSESGIPAEEPFTADPAEAVPEPVTDHIVQPEDLAEQALSRVVSGDTLFLLVYALHGNLEPLRVRSDVFLPGQDNQAALRPYWVEHRQAMRFEFIEEIIFQGTLSRLVFVFNGHIIDDFSDYYLDGPRIRITRDDLLSKEEFEQPHPMPFDGFPEPDQIVDRPRFIP